MKLTFALLFSLLLFLTPVASTSANGVLSGQVRDVVEGAPVGRAYVLIHPSGWGRDIHVTTERDGKFSAELPPGFYDVFVTAVGFAPTCSKVRVRAGQTTKYTQESECPNLSLSPIEQAERSRFGNSHPLSAGGPPFRLLLAKVGPRRPAQNENGPPVHWRAEFPPAP